jgi:tetratricopeptide (TPR) repeat protein
MRPRLVCNFACWIRISACLLLFAATVAAQQPKREAEAPRKSVRELEAAITRSPGRVDLYVQLGLAYWDQNDYPHALHSFQRAVKVGPRSADAHNWLGVALSEKADLPGAIAAFRKAIALNPKYGRAYTNLGSALMKSGDVTEAVTVFQQALALEPNNLAAHLNLGMALREKGDLDAALAELRPVAAADPANAGIHYELGQTLRQAGDLAGAAAELEHAIEINPELREGYYALGLTLKQQRGAPPSLDLPPPAAEAYKRAADAIAKGDLSVARDQLARVIALRPDFAEAHYNLGVALWYGGEREKAVAALRESLRLDGAAGATHALMGIALRETGDLAGARVSLQRAIALLPPTAAVYVDLGITFLRAGDLAKALGQLDAALHVPEPARPAPDWDGAIAALRGALQTAPQDVQAQAEAHNALGLLLGRKGADSTQVAAEFREAIRLRRDYADAHNNLGLVLIQAGDDEGGIAALREAVRLAPDDAEAHANLGAAITPTDAAAAVRELEKAVALAPASVKAQYNLAIAYGALPNRGGATSATAGAAKEIDGLRKVIALAPTFGRAHLALGKALLRDGKVDDAIAELEEVARLEPENGEAHYQLGLALSRAGRKDEAAAALKKGRDLVAAADRVQLADKPREAPTNEPAPLDDAARMSELEGYIRDGKFAEVEPLLAEYVKQRAKSSWGWYALGYSQFAQQKIGDSIKSLAKSLELDIRNAEAHKILGRDLMIIGRFDAARVEFEEGLRYKPDSAELHYNLGKLFSIQDNWEPARKEFEAALKADANYVEAIDALGFALEALGDDAGAVARYRQAIAINDGRKGTFAASHVNLSAYYNRTGDAEKALDHAKQAIALDPKSDRAWFQRARAEERQGRLEDAVAALNTAIAYNPRASSYYYVLAGVCRRLGWTDDSKKALDTFQRLDRESTELDKKRRGVANPDATPPGPKRE